MISKLIQRLFFALSTLGLVGLSQAQITSNATCLSSFSYLFNIEGQSPCIVAAYLGGACNNGQYDVSALNTGEHYTSPTSTSTDPCQCSTVMYSMMGACSACQNATIITWTTWDAACWNVYVGVFPEDIPANTGVPSWAYSNVTGTNIFSPQVAIGNTGIESTKKQSQTTETLQTTQTETRNNNDSKTDPPQTGVIVGAVLGGIVALSLALTVLCMYFRRFRRRRVVWYSAAGSQTRNIHAMMTEADPYILQTTTHTNIPRHNETLFRENSPTGPDIEILRSRRKQLAARATSEQPGIAAADESRQGNPRQIPANRSGVNTRKVRGVQAGPSNEIEGANNVTRSTHQNAIAPTSLRLNTSSLPHDVGGRGEGDDSAIPNSDADAIRKR